jgi:peptide deformylase
MTLLKIAHLGHPALLRPALPVDEPRAPECRTLVADMIETMQDADGVGLAAPQVYRSLRLIVALPVRDREERRAPEPLVIFNPELELDGGPEISGLEGCLSIPGLRGMVPRAGRVRYRGQDREGVPIEGTAEGFFARILQHEVDHLDGVLFPMRMRDLSLLAMNDEAHHLREVVLAADEE